MSVPMNRVEDLVEQIERTFIASCKEAKLAPNEIITCQCEDCSSMARFLSQASLAKLELEELRGNEDALLHAEPKAYKKLLPYFMLGVIQDIEKSQAIPDLILSSFYPVSNQLSLFSKKQIDVAISFVKHLSLSETFADQEADISEALANLKKAKEQNRKKA